MDYEKKYNEALEHARQAYGTGAYDDQTLEAIFPELRELEDERVMGDLIGGLMWQRDNLRAVGPHDNSLILPGFCLTVGEHLAYLEKRIEQKEIPLMNGDADLYFDEWNQQNQNPTKRQCFEEGIRYAQRLQKEQNPIMANSPQLKEQKPEEKPINWTELTWKDIDKLEGIINNVHYEFRNGIGQESFGKEVLEKFREYKGDEYLDEIEQKPAWSEEDERVIDTIVSVLGQYIDYKTVSGTGSGYATPRYSKEIDWLKSLRPQLSDEDIKKIRSEEYTKGFNDAVFGGKAWKPSEEQMEALEYVIRDYREDGCNATANYLQEILDHLKNM